MRRQAVLVLCALALGACASVPPPAPLTAAQVVQLAKEGRSAQQIIEELKRTDTVIILSASDIVRLHEAGVPREVLDHMQRAQIDEIRWHDRFAHMYWYGPFYRGFGPCPLAAPARARAPVSRRSVGLLAAS